MKARLWVVQLFIIATIVSWPYSANAVTISFTENESRIDSTELFPTPHTTVTTDLGMCAGGGAPPCWMTKTPGKETASIMLRVPFNTFADPDNVRQAIPPLPPQNPADSHLARAFLLENATPGDISDIVVLQFISGGGTPAAPAPDQINITFTSDASDNFGRTPNGFVFAEKGVETGGNIELNPIFFTGPVNTPAQQRGYCQAGPCGANADLPSGWTITAQSDVETVPESSTLALLVIGVLGLVFCGWRWVTNYRIPFQPRVDSKPA